MTASIVPFKINKREDEASNYVTACIDTAVRLKEYANRVDEAYDQIAQAKYHSDRIRKVLKSILRRVVNARRENLAIDIPAEGHEALKGIEIFLARAKLAQPDASDFLRRFVHDDEAHELVIIDFKYLRNGFPDWK